MISRGSAIFGGVAGLVLSFAPFTVINAVWLLPDARMEARDRLIAEQAVSHQKAELERKGDDAKLQTLTPYDLCVAGLGGNGMPVDACDQLRGPGEE
jgi:hypothetical protein